MTIIPARCQLGVDFRQRCCKRASSRKRKGTSTTGFALRNNRQRLTRPQLARARTSLAEALWGLQESADAEAQLDIALAIEEIDELQKQRAISIRGAILASQQKWEVAEPLLVESAASLAAQLAEMKRDFRWYVPRAQERVIAMFEARNQPAEVMKWKVKLAEVKAEIERLRNGGIVESATKDTQR